MGASAVLYFSRHGLDGVADAALYLDLAVGAHMAEVVPVDAYPVDGAACTLRVREELSSGARPAIEPLPAFVAASRLVYVAFPSWLDRVPPCMLTALGSMDLAGRRVAPLVAGRATPALLAELTAAVPGANVTEALSIDATDGGSEASRRAIREWALACQKGLPR